MAERLNRESLKAFHELGDKRCIAYRLEHLGSVAAQLGSPVRAARLLGAADALREVVGVPLDPEDQAEHARAVAAVRAALGEAGFAVAWGQGQAMSMEEAVCAALAQEEIPTTGGQGSEDPGVTGPP